MKLLEGEDSAVERRQSEQAKDEVKEEEKLIEEKELKEVEVRRAIKKMKLGKAAGSDGIPMEAWKYDGQRVWRRLMNLLRQIWKEGEIPSDWRKI